MLLSIHPDNPQDRLIQIVVSHLKKGGVIIYPTDTIYGIGCDIYNKNAIERICRIKNIDPKKAQFSFLCSDLSNLSNYARNVSNPTFRVLKHYLPGPYTFILQASREVPKLLKTKKETVGIRIPDHAICQAIIAALGNPIMTTSLPIKDDVAYYSDPEIIYEELGHLVDLVIDAGIGGIIGSTVINCVDDEPVLIREGLGKWEE